MTRTDPNRAVARLDSALLPFLQSVRRQVTGRVWIVGGFLRDAALGRRPFDLDLAVEGDARATAAALGLALGGHAFPLDEERETYRVTMGASSSLAIVDVSKLRGPTIEADLSSRDFTINAMASELGDSLGPVVDPLHGLDDLKRRTVRMVSEGAFRDDPLRLMRAARFAVELDFDVDQDTMQVIRALAPSVTGAAGERRREELARILASDSAARGLRLLDALGLLEVLMPEVTRGRGIVQPGDYHHYDVFDHNIEAVAVADRLLGVRAPAGRTPRAMRDEFWTALGRFGLREYFAGSAGGQTRLVLTKLATLLHDISKPETMTRDETGRIHFLGHAEQGAKAGRAICRRFKLGNKETDFVSVLIEEHLRPPQLAQSGAPTDRAIFRFFRALGDAAPACLVLSLADAASAQGPRLTLSRWRAHLAYIGYVLERGTAQTVSLGGQHFVSGDTLIRALGIPPGPEVGRLLAAIDEAAAAGEVRDEEAAIELARAIRKRSMPPVEEAGR